MDTTIASTSTLHNGWTHLLRVRIRLSDGREFDREVEDHGRAVAILPYDPVRRIALLVQLVRAPVLLATGKGNVMEAPAGLIEKEDPADAAQRELLEETGLLVCKLEYVGSVWTSPGISTERMELYLAPFAESDRVALGGGVPNENENITVVQKELHKLWAMVQACEIDDMKTLSLILMLYARKPYLFA